MTMVPRSVCFAVSLGFLASIAGADIATWANSVSGTGRCDQWSNQSAYPNNGSPSPTYDVIVDAVGAPYTITLSSQVNINNFRARFGQCFAAKQHCGLLRMPGPFEIASGSVLLNGGSLGSGASRRSSAVLQVARSPLNSTPRDGAERAASDSAVLRLLNGNVNLSGVRMSYSGVSGQSSRVMVYGATPTIAFGGSCF